MPARFRPFRLGEKSATGAFSQRGRHGTKVKLQLAANRLDSAASISSAQRERHHACGVSRFLPRYMPATAHERAEAQPRRRRRRAAPKRTARSSAAKPRQPDSIRGDSTSPAYRRLVDATRSSTARKSRWGTCSRIPAQVYTRTAFRSPPALNICNGESMDETRQRIAERPALLGGRSIENSSRNASPYYKQSGRYSTSSTDGPHQGGGYTERAAHPPRRRDCELRTRAWRFCRCSLIQQRGRSPAKSVRSLQHGLGLVLMVSPKTPPRSAPQSGGADHRRD